VAGRRASKARVLEAYARQTGVEALQRGITGNDRGKDGEGSASAGVVGGSFAQPLD
jgi:hypothetical protein